MSLWQRMVLLPEDPPLTEVDRSLWELTTEGFVTLMLIGGSVGSRAGLSLSFFKRKWALVS